AAVEEMAEVLTGYARKAYRYSARLEPGQLNTDRTVVGLPLTDYGKERTGLESMPAEMQAVTYGSLAMVTLPGEPMTELGMEIRKRSPYPQTLVLGYSNGNGVHYVGMPGEKKHGGHEVGEKTNLGTDRAGLIMVEAAEDLLHKMHEKNNSENENEKHIVFLIGEHDNSYESHRTIPEYARQLEEHHDYKTTVISGEGERTAFHFPRLEVLSEADLLVVFTRRVALKPDQMNR